MLTWDIMTTVSTVLNVTYATNVTIVIFVTITKIVSTAKFICKIVAFMTTVKVSVLKILCNFT